MEIEIKEYEGAGYSPIITYDRWRVAVANYAEKFHPDNFSYLEMILFAKSFAKLYQKRSFA